MATKNTTPKRPAAQKSLAELIADAGVDPVADGTHQVSLGGNQVGQVTTTSGIITDVTTPLP